MATEEAGAESEVMNALRAQIRQHAPSLRVVVYEGLRALKDERAEEERKGRKRKRGPRKMSREQRFNAALVRTSCLARRTPLRLRVPGPGRTLLALA